MFAHNAVDPSSSTRILYDGSVGQHSHLVARDDERGALDVVRMLGLASLLAVAYVVGGIAGAGPAPATVTDRPVPIEQDGGIGGPVGKQGAAPFATPVVGEFRLGPGNNAAPGLVTGTVTVPVVEQIVGDFRLGPGNNAAPGLVTAPTSGTAMPEDLHGGEGGDLPADAILPFE